MTYFEKIFELSDRLTHQVPADGFEEFYMEKIVSMRRILAKARYLDEENPSTASNSEEMKKLMKEAELLV